MSDMAGDMTLREMQEEQGVWADRNFGSGRPSWQPLLGAVEEVGELAHAHLKQAQGIRGTMAEHRAAKIDAVGDIIVFLADYCNIEDIDLQGAVQTTWEDVRTRDWRANAVDGSSA